MSPHLTLTTAGLAFALFALPSSAQTLRPFRTDDDRPIPRAQPVRPPQPIPGDPVAPPDTPPVVPRVATPIPIRRAVPARPSAPPVATPIPVPQPSDPGEIRIAPQTGVVTPDQATIDSANGYYARKMFDVAASEYQMYLDRYPGAPESPTALFRLAECNRELGSSNAAKALYDAVLSRYPNSDFSGPAAYRLATLYYAEKNYALALPLYRKASVRLKEPAVIIAAKFFIARSLEAQSTGYRSVEAADLYREIADSKEPNQFQEASRLSLALLLHDSSRLPDAVKQIKLLASVTENPELKAEATVRAGLWQLELQSASKPTNDAGKKLAEEALRKAADDLTQALAMPGIGKWKEPAQIGLIRMNFDAGKYDQVVQMFNEGGSRFSAESKPELMLLAANAQRQLGKNAEALSLYDQLLKEFATTPSAREAGYQRLVTLYNTDDPKLLTSIDDYLSGTNDTEKRDQVLLMKGETLYKKQDYSGAAPIYAAVAKSRLLPGGLRAEAFFKLGWCSMQVRDFEKAVAAFTELIDTYPTFKSISLALAQRAVAYQNQKNLTAAEKDYTLLIKKFPKSKERELALQQKALIRGQQNDNAGMVENFELLLRDFPETPAAPQAHYWLGRGAYDSKDYKRAAEQLSLAREQDRDQFFEKASLPLILSYYYLNDLASVAKEVDGYKKDGKGQIPLEVLRWLSEKYLESGTYDSAERFLSLVTAREDATPGDFLKLGRAQLRLQKYGESAQTLGRYLQSVKEPPTKAVGLQELARAEIGIKDYAAAQKAVDESLSLQPEGKLSGEAIILAGDIQQDQGNDDQAAKLYMSVALVLDDEEITPRALEKAVACYQKAGRDPEAKKALNTLQSRYPEYLQQKKK